MKQTTITLFLSILCFSSITAQPSIKKKIINHYYTMYNRHQTDSLMTMVSENFKMYSLTQDTTTLDIEGKEGLRKWLTGYFKDLPNVSSMISDLHVSGNFVSFIETVRWGDHKSQSSLAVYEIVDKRIRRAWYYY